MYSIAIIKQERNFKKMYSFLLTVFYCRLVSIQVKFCLILVYVHWIHCVQKGENDIIKIVIEIKIYKDMN